MTPPRRRALNILVLAGALILAWTVVATVSNGAGALHPDFVEAYVWGRQFQLGYYKHPPLWAWIAGLWFSAFPRADWAAYLLAAINAAIGVVGAWRLIGCFADGPKRTAATLLLLATPFYTSMAMRFNANAALLPLWPWTLFFFVRSLDQRRWVDAVGLGALVGLAALSKYYAVVLVGGCALSLPLHSRGWSWLRSPAPWIAGGVALAVFAPHLWWLVHNRFPTVGYFQHETGRTLAFTLANVARMPLEWLAFHGIVVLVAALAAGTGPRAWIANLQARWRDPRLRLMVGLTAWPLILTLLAGLAFRLKLSSNWTEAAFPLVPLLVIETVGGEARRIERASWITVLAITALALIVSPILEYRPAGRREPNRTEPRRELAAQADRLWRQEVGRPLPIVAGSAPYDEAIAFYSTGRPSVFIDFDRRHAPWITPAALAREGWLAACVSGDAACIAKAEALSGPTTRRSSLTLAHRLGARLEPPVSFQIFLTPPGGAGG
jgi:4-amino-4-deoxy-L-arabinose transferase-like glycosyltransferase